jgi:hypothetical protein
LWWVIEGLHAVNFKLPLSTRLYCLATLPDWCKQIANKAHGWSLDNNRSIDKDRSDQAEKK